MMGENSTIIAFAGQLSSYLGEITQLSGYFTPFPGQTEEGFRTEIWYR